MKKPLIYFLLSYASLNGASLTKAGNGVLTVAGDSSVSFTDPLVINAGTLSATNGTNIGSNIGQLTIGTATLQTTGAIFSTARTTSLTGTANFDITTGTATFSGVISGTGSLTKSSITSSILVLSNVNTFSGGTTVNGGTLSLSAAGSLPANRNVTLANSALVNLNDNDQSIGGLSGSSSSSAIDLGVLDTTVLTVGNLATTSSFSGVIQGAGNLTKTSTGNFTITGANTYSGGTLVSAGTLTGNTTSFQGSTSGRNITNNATIVFDQSSSGAYGNIMNGTGDLIKQNTGVLTLSGIVIQENVNVTAGTLTVANSAIAPTALTVSSGATLNGTGTIHSTVTNSGTIAPGASIGTLTIIGNYTQATGSTLEVELNSTTSDLLAVIGSVTIEPGATLSVFPEFASYGPNTIYTLVFGAGGISGTFSSVILNLDSFDATVFYFPNTVALVINLVPFSELVIGGGNAAVVAACVDATPAPTGSDFQGIVDRLLFMDPEELTSTLNQMQPSLFNAIDLVEEETYVNIRGALTRRLNDIHLGNCSDKQPYHTWVDFFYDHATQHPIAQQSGFKSITQGIVVGVDRLGKNGDAGFAFSYTKNQIVWEEKAGLGTIESYYGMAYWTLKSSYLYMQAAGILGLNYNKANRRIEFVGAEFSPMTRFARHNSGGYGGLTYIEFGATLFKENAGMELNPYARADYVFIYRNGFTERDAGSIDLDVQAQKSDLLRIEAGIQLQKCFPSQNYGTWIPHVKLGWILEERYHGVYSNSSFVDSTCVMRAKGMKPSRDIIAPAVGIIAQFLSGRLIFDLEGEGEWGSNYEDYSAALNITWGF